MPDHLPEPEGLFLDRPVHPAGVGALAAQLGGAGFVPELDGDCWTHTIADAPSLAAFLVRMRDELLVPIECPAIIAAWKHSAANQARELIALDRQLNGAAMPEPFRIASRRVGQVHLRRLRPLRDQRLLQRYSEAVRRGAAHGWHTVVYGVALHIYSLPVRQGIAAYTQQTLSGFVRAAGQACPVSEAERAAVLAEVLAPLHPQLERLLPNPCNGGPSASLAF